MDDLIISDDKNKLDIELIHTFLTASYCAEGGTLEEVKNSTEHSICFGVYKNDSQIGFARIVSDLTIIAYLMDVFILEEYRGKGYSKLLLRRIFDDVRFKGIKKWILATKDAHSLYACFGFEKLKNPDRLMEKVVLKK